MRVKSPDKFVSNDGALMLLNDGRDESWVRCENPVDAEP